MAISPVRFRQLTCMLLNALLITSCFAARPVNPGTGLRAMAKGSLQPLQELSEHVQEIFVQSLNKSQMSDLFTKDKPRRKSFCCTQPQPAERKLEDTDYVYELTP